MMKFFSIFILGFSLAALAEKPSLIVLGNWNQKLCAYEVFKVYNPKDPKDTNEENVGPMFVSAKNIEKLKGELKTQDSTEKSQRIPLPESISDSKSIVIEPSRLHKNPYEWVCSHFYIPFEKLRPHIDFSPVIQKDCPVHPESSARVRKCNFQEDLGDELDPTEPPATQAQERKPINHSKNSDVVR